MIILICLICIAVVIGFRERFDDKLTDTLFFRRRMLGNDKDFCHNPDELEKYKGKLCIIHLRIHTGVDKIFHDLNWCNAITNTKVKFIAILNAHDAVVPDEIMESISFLINSGKCIRIYSPNVVAGRISNNFLKWIPLGINFTGGRDIKSSPKEQENKLIEKYNKSLSIKKKFACVISWNNDTSATPNSNFNNLSMIDRGFTNVGRDEYLNKLKTTDIPLVYANNGGRNEFWNACTKNIFVAAPIGIGLDTYRMWEALILGCIVIVQPSDMIASIPIKLPIIVVDDPSILTLDILKSHYNELIDLTTDTKTREFYNYNYWKQQITGLHHTTNSP